MRTPDSRRDRPSWSRRAARTVLPAPWRRYLREQYLQLTLGRSLARMRRLPPGAELPGSLAEALIHGWGNEPWSARREFLQAVYRSGADTPGPILECGSGLTTLLLGRLVAGSGMRIYTLEHDAFWAEKVRAALDRYRIAAVELCVAPLRTYGAYDWYDPPRDRLPRDFALVVCDGPPGRTPGGRYGLVPEMRSHLAPGCVILLDDAHRDGEAEALGRWAAELETSFELSGSDHVWAKMTIPPEETNLRPASSHS